MLLRDGQCLNQEFRYRKRKGEVITGLTSAVLIEVENRRYTIVLIMDITDRKRAQEALIQDQVYMRSIIDSLPGIFCIVDQQGGYLIWNRNYGKVTGYSNTEISSMTVMDRTPAPDRKAVSEKMRYAFEQETLFEQYGLVCRDGTVRDYLFNYARMEYQGRLCLIVNGLDISEQKQTQDNLTPQEIQVADLIRKGKRTKEIADMLHTSASTIGTHRNHIREKLNLKKEGIHLRSYLQSLH
jgi:PAS domain S-box-containing protein